MSYDPVPRDPFLSLRRLGLAGNLAPSTMDPRLSGRRRFGGHSTGCRFSAPDPPRCRVGGASAAAERVAGCRRLVTRSPAAWSGVEGSGPPSGHRKAVPRLLRDGSVVRGSREGRSPEDLSANGDQF
ncbi:unnamed protein product [Urochloa humidicola]